jgi:hypothetical protein
VYSIRASTLRADVIVKIVTLMTVSNPPNRVETIAFPSLSVSERPVGASENTVVSDLWRPTGVLLDANRPDFKGSIVAAGLHDFFERPAGHAMFEQIGMAVQGRLEEIGLRGMSTPLGSRSCHLWFNISIRY